MTRLEQKSRNKRLTLRLLLLSSLMFGFGYALIPLYDVFCEVTGLNGKTRRISATDAAAVTVDDSRLVTVEFVTSVTAGMPWTFAPALPKIAVHPGAETLVYFEATNTAAREVVGNAVPSVSPNALARYFSKTECFCFTQQSLGPGESKSMPVRFVVDPKIPEHVTVLTLGYTFFESIATGTHDRSSVLPPVAEITIKLSDRESTHG